MSIDDLHHSRVAQAHAEVGQTEVSRPVALTLVALFVAIVTAVPTSQAWMDHRVLHGVTGAAANAATREDRPSSISRVINSNRQMLAAIKRFTDRLDTDSLVARHLRPAVQLLLTQRLGSGNERVYTGRDDWLYYATDVQHVIGRGFLETAQLARRAASGDSLSQATAPDPRPALRAFNDALDRRGITLVLLPTPVKPSIHPEHLGVRASLAPVRNASFSKFADEMRAAGVLLFDPAPLLADFGATGNAAYLARDTHWRPDAVVAVAQELARFLDRETPLPERGPASLDASVARVSSAGDIVGLLDLPAEWSPYPAETAEVRRILTADGRPWTPDPTADVILIGDSFANIFSLEAMGWGTAAGLAEQLSFALGRPIDRLVQNANGAFASREALARELARGHDRLAGKRVVIYQFATRELTFGDWRLVDLDAPRPAPASAVLTPEPGQVLSVQGRIRQLTLAPRPGTVPYRDHIISVDLVDIDAGITVVSGTEALVYLSSMEDNVWTVAASLVVGQNITLTLRPWAEVAPELDGITRSELIEGNVVFAEPWWGELATLRLTSP
jgi:alginate O-acetyltransferase complex protein AlgJ